MKLPLNNVVFVIQSLILINSIAVGVHGAVYGDDTVICTEVEVHPEGCDYVFFQEVCATGSYSTPSPVQDENGTITYIGGYQNIYTILGPGEIPGGDVPIGTVAPGGVGIEIRVWRDDNDMCTGITMIQNDIWSSCNSCTYCGNDTYSYDCSNLPYGTVVNDTHQICASIVPGVDVLFPFTYDFMINITGAEPIHDCIDEVTVIETEEETEEEESFTLIQWFIHWLTGLI